MMDDKKLIIRRKHDYYDGTVTIAVELSSSTYRLYRWFVDALAGWARSAGFNVADTDD